MRERYVQGYCPMGCGQTLFLGERGYVTCWYVACPAPVAVSDLLAIGETEHIVNIREHDFTVQHPLRERLDGDLFKCRLHGKLAALDGPPCTPGRYRVVASAGRASGLAFTPLPDGEGGVNSRGGQ